jgi:hypothetical protein
LSNFRGSCHFPDGTSFLPPPSGKKAEIPDGVASCPTLPSVMPDLIGHLPTHKAWHPKLKQQFGPCKADFVFSPTSATGGKRHYPLSEALLGWGSAV